MELPDDLLKTFIQQVLSNGIQGTANVVINPSPYGPFKWLPGILLYDTLSLSDVLLFCPKHHTQLMNTDKWCDLSNGAYPPRTIYNPPRNFLLVSKR
jgi:hypothetical protein